MDTIERHPFTVTEQKTGKGWTVTITRDGCQIFFAVFRDQAAAEIFANKERRKLGLNER